MSRTGRVPMPGPNEALLGGHAVLAVGYDDAAGVFLIRNSWGSSWGQRGYGAMPYAYLADGNLSDDFWTIGLLEGDSRIPNPESLIPYPESLIPYPESLIPHPVSESLRERCCDGAP